MDKRTLEAFLVLADTLHFGRAAAACHISPSALSRQVQRLEQELQCQLFERDNRRVALTAAGRKARRQAEDIVQRWREMEQDLRGSITSLRGEMSLYCSVTASHSLLSELLPEWRRRQPQVEIKLHTGDEAQAIQRVLRGDDDLAIAARPQSLPDQLRFQELASTPLVFIAPQLDCPAYRLLAGFERLGEDFDWSRLPMILPEAGEGRRAVEEWFRARDSLPQVYAQVSGNEAVVSMVSLGFGVGVVPLLVLRGSPLAERVRVLDVDHPPQAYTVGLCARRERGGNPVVDVFWQLARELRRAS